MRRVVAMICLVWLMICVSGCRSETPAGTEDATVWLNMNMDYPQENSLPDGKGEQVKVILLLGQSNATGCSINAYLEKQIPEVDYRRYAEGFSTVLINFCLDDHNATSNGQFVPVDLNCGSAEGFFGPEVGMAEVLADACPEERILILKYTMSGYSLHYHWLCDGQRGSIYEACMAFLQQNLTYLTQRGYVPQIGAVCWMQGESDTTQFKASHYYENQMAFARYLREDLSSFAPKGGLYFIDAGISNSPYCEPAYPQVNAAKECFSQQSPLNLYFSTIDAGFTVHLEPEGEPDWGHYDALSELELGRLFGQKIVEAYQKMEE